MAEIRVIAKPQLTRVVSNRQQAKLTKPQPVRSRQAPPRPQLTIKGQLVPKPIQTPPSAVPRSVVVPQRPGIVSKARPRTEHQKKPGPRKSVRYITPDISSMDLERIKNLRNMGLAKNGERRVLVIIGNGPSVSEIDTTPLHGEPGVDVMAINKPDPRCWPPKYWTFFDKTQLRRHNDLWSTYNGHLLNGTVITERRPGTVIFKKLEGSGFSLDLMSGVYIGRSSVYAALQFAVWLNYERIYVLGCDMCEVGGKLHFYGVNPDVPATDRKKRFDGEAVHYQSAAETLPLEIRNKIWFCSDYNKYEFVQKFRHSSHKCAVQDVLDYVRGVD